MRRADVDECASGAHHCHENARCENTQGAFRCTCAAGYSGNGESCSRMRPLLLLVPDSKNGVLLTRYVIAKNSEKSTIVLLLLRQLYARSPARTAAAASRPTRASARTASRDPIANAVHSTPSFMVSKVIMTIDKVTAEWKWLSAKATFVCWFAASRRSGRMCTASGPLLGARVLCEPAGRLPLRVCPRLPASAEPKRSGAGA